MSLTREALQELRNMIRAEEPVILTPDHELTGDYLLLQADGSYDIYRGTRPPHPLVLRDTTSVAVLIDTLAAGIDSLEELAVYWQEDQVQIVDASDGDREPVVHRMPLEPHPVALELQGLASSQSFTQRELVRFLRSRLAPYVPAEIIERFRAARYTVDAQTDRVIGRADHTLDRKVKERMLDGDSKPFPDELLIHAPMIDTREPGEYAVTVLVDTTPDGEGAVRFTLTTVWSTYRQAVTDAAADIVDRIYEKIEASGVPCLHGRMT